MAAMPTMETPITGEDRINEAVIGNDSAEQIIGELEHQQELMQKESETIQRYIDGIRPQVEGAVVEKLEQGVAGQYDGDNVTVAKRTLIVDGSVEETIDFASEVRRHENYHQEHDHTAAMQAADSASGDSVVNIGGTDFNDIELIEGITVARTGEEFVSNEYRQYKADLLAAVGQAGIDLTVVEEAIGKKDLRLIDQAQREKKAEQPAAATLAV